MFQRLLYGSLSGSNIRVRLASALRAEITANGVGRFPEWFLLSSTIEMVGRMPAEIGVLRDVDGIPVALLVRLSPNKVPMSLVSDVTQTLAKLSGAE